MESSAWHPAIAMRIDASNLKSATLAIGTIRRMKKARIVVGTEAASTE